METSITVSSEHNFENGMHIVISTPDPRWWMRLWRFVTFRSPPMTNRHMQIVDLNELLSGWISVDDELPALGEKVILFANGVVQEEIYEMDEADISDYTNKRFWWRYDLEDCPEVKSGQYWMRLPESPAR